MTLKSLLLLTILLYYALIFHPITASTPAYLDSRCSNNRTFAPNSNYQSNLNSVFLSLTSKAATNTAGNTTSNDVYGLYLCRGDLSSVSCKTCVEAATVVLSESYCPLKKAGVIWYAECMVRYSNDYFFGRMVESPKLIMSNGRNMTGNETQFSEDLKNTLTQLVIQAGKSTSKKTFLEKVEKITEFQMLRVFSQCTADLTGNDCARCLKIAAGRLLVGITGRVMQPSCNVFYEVYESNDSRPSLSYSKIRNRKAKNTLWTEVIVATIVPVSSISLAVVALCLILKKPRKFSLRDAYCGAIGEDLITANSLQYNFATLQSATNNFSDENKLGQGGFGTVYKGTLSDGQLVAVKRLARSSCGRLVQVFKNELLVVAKLQHRNLVRLVGFCLAGEEKLLVYEYVPNKSLDYFLFDPTKQDQLDWGIRYNIIRGIARGMLYLHQDSRLRIIHRDLKAANTLLDGDMNPKISDFEVAEIFGEDQSESNSRPIRGTIGYMSPEILLGQFSAKSDVYSFGVLVLEILSGKRNSGFYQSGYAEGLLSDALKHWSDNTPLDFVDETIRDSCLINEVRRCMHLGLLCTQESADQRPTMATVVLMLDSQSIALPMPEKPSFFAVIRPDLSTAVPCSMNEVSISELEPR